MSEIAIVLGEVRKVSVLRVQVQVDCAFSEFPNIDFHIATHSSTEVQMIGSHLPPEIGQIDLNLVIDCTISGLTETCEVLPHQRSRSPAS